MTDLSRNMAEGSRQQFIRAKCFHPIDTFVEIKKEETEQSIPDRFEQQVRRYPDRLAVETRRHQFTYEDLNKAANRVARAILAQRGEGQEPIALLLRDNATMIVAILGVLKARKIYVPLDPSYPRARIAAILENSQPGLIVTDNMLLSLANESGHSTLQLVNIDEIDASLSTENIGLSISPDTLSWILYTSGSTGKSKGVAQNHRTCFTSS